MSIYIGSQKIGSLYLGSTKIKEAWVGDVKVYGSGSYHFDEVQIGNQIWMAKNLAIDDGQGEPGGIFKRTVNYGQGDVVEYYYDWYAAVRVADTIPGWHLPSNEEWDILADAVGGASIAGLKLKSSYGWYDDGNGTDEYGFTALPAGYSDTYFGERASFLTSTEPYGSPLFAYRRTFLYSSDRMGTGRGSIENPHSVRLIKD